MVSKSFLIFLMEAKTQARIRAKNAKILGSLIISVGHIMKREKGLLEVVHSFWPIYMEGIALCFNTPGDRSRKLFKISVKYTPSQIPTTE